MDLLRVFMLPGQVGVAPERPLSCNCPQQHGSAMGVPKDWLLLDEEWLDLMGQDIDPIQQQCPSVPSQTLQYLITDLNGSESVRMPSLQFFVGFPLLFMCCSLCPSHF